MEIAIRNKSLPFLPLREQAPRKKRIFEIDLLRGILIILMILDHLAYDFGILANEFFIAAQAPEWLRNIYLWSEGYWFADWRINVRYVVVALFFILTGLSAYLSRNSIKRAMLIIGFGAIVSIVAYLGSTIFKTNMFIFFGIISCLGVSLLIYSLFRLFIIKTTGSRSIWKWCALFLALLFMSTGFWMRIEATTISINAQNWWMLINGRLVPTIRTYTTINGVFTPINYDFKMRLAIVLGQAWYGVDWAGLFPYIGYAFLGGFFGELLYKNKRSLIFKKNGSDYHKVEKALKPLTYIGSKTIYIYLFHQAVLALVAFVVYYLSGVPLR